MVDDEPMIQEMMAEVFSDCGAVVHKAGNVDDAFEIAVKHKFDVVFSDIRMPGGDGLSLVEKLKTLKDYQPKIFLFSGHSDITRSQARGLGVEELFPKPFNFDQIIEMVCLSLK